MKELASASPKSTADHQDFGHPIDLTLAMEPYFEDAALEEPI